MRSAGTAAPALPGRIPGCGVVGNDESGLEPPCHSDKQWVERPA
jgi:hypothetical protein